MKLDGCRATNRRDGAADSACDHPLGQCEGCEISSAPSVTAASKERLRHIMGSGGKITSGSIQILGLDEIQKELSNRWDKVKERVHEYTIRMLKNYLSPADAWFRNSDDNYIIVFAHIEKEAAQLLCGRIADELHRLLLGHSDTQKVTIRTVVSEINGRFTVETASLDKLLSNAAARCSRGFSEGTPGHSSVEDAPRSATLDNAPAASPTFLSEPEPFHPRIRFRPVFDLRHKVVSTYVCRPDTATKCYVEISRADDLRHEEAVFQLDREALIQAVDTYAELYANRFRYAQNLPVHFATMAVSRYRREYVKLCRAIPSHLIPFIAFTLEDLPSGVPYGRLAEIVTMLKPYGRAVLASVGDASPDLASYAQAGVRGIGITLDADDRSQRATKRIQTMCGMAKKYNLFAYVDGIRSAELLRVAEQAGAAYLAGPVIGEDTEVPEHMRRCTESELIMRARVKMQRAM